jgi:Domain of unknown function (DUF2019)
MRRRDLSKLTVDDLVERFAAIGVEQDQALFDGDTSKFTRLFWQMEAVSNELKSRDNDERRALLRLYDHPNMQVRLKATIHTLAVEPEVARKKLQAIADSGWLPQSGDAGMSLWNLERGVFKPT